MKYEDIYIQKNILTPADIQWLKSELNVLKSQPDVAAPRTKKNERFNQLYMVRHPAPLRQNIEDFFSKLFPFDQNEYAFYSVNFYELQNSYGLHCDNLGSGRGFYQAVIPIECPQKPTYTVVFEQTASENVEWVSPIFKKPTDYKPHHNKPIFDANWFGGWRDEHRIPYEQGEHFWGPRWKETFYEAYKGFSVKCAYEWSVGDIFIFNSSFTHCASELETLNIPSKTGLLMCLQRRI